MFRPPGPPILTVLPYPSVVRCRALQHPRCAKNGPEGSGMVRDPDTGQGRPARNVAAANGRPDAVPGPKSSVTMGGTSGAQTAGRRSAPVRPRKCFTIAANGERVWRSGPRRLLASQDEEADLLMPAPPPSDGHKDSVGAYIGDRRFAIARCRAPRREQACRRSQSGVAQRARAPRQGGASSQSSWRAA